MTPIIVHIQRLHPELGKSIPLPQCMSELAAGLDVASAIDESVTLMPGERSLIPCGFAMAVPFGYECQVRPRSGLAIKHGVTVINSPGTIDADYRGEVNIGLINLGPEPYTIQRGDRVAQLVIGAVQKADLHLVEELDKTVRQTGGFGHTGK